MSEETTTQQIQAAQEAIRRSKLPATIVMVVLLAFAFSGAVFATLYRLTWLLFLSCVVGAAAVVVWFLRIRRQDRYEASVDAAARAEKVRAYRRDLEATLIGYDVDRDMTQEEIDELVAEYQHKLEVESTNLAKASPSAVIKGVLGKRAAEKKAAREDKAIEEDAKVAAAEARASAIQQGRLRE